MDVRILGTWEKTLATLEGLATETQEMEDLVLLCIIHSYMREDVDLGFLEELAIEAFCELAVVMTLNQCYGVANKCGFVQDTLAFSGGCCKVSF